MQWRKRYSEFSKTLPGQALFLSAVFFLFWSGIAWRLLNFVFIAWWLSPFIFLLYSKVTSSKGSGTRIACWRDALYYVHARLNGSPNRAWTRTCRALAAAILTTSAEVLSRQEVCSETTSVNCNTRTALHEPLMCRPLGRTERGRGSSRGRESSRGNKATFLPPSFRIRGRHHSSNNQGAAAGSMMGLMMDQSLT